MELQILIEMLEIIIPKLILKRRIILIKALRLRSTQMIVQIRISLSINLVLNYQLKVEKTEIILNLIIHINPMYKNSSVPIKILSELIQNI